MDGGQDDPAVQRRRLRVELRRLRQDGNLNQRTVARAMDWSVSKLIRIEHGEVGISSNDLKVLLEYYQVNDEQRAAELLEMARHGRKDSWAEYRGVHSSPFLTYLGYESSAGLIRTFEPQLVPGLLQTEEYARATLSGTHGEAKEIIDRRWRGRQERQRLHDRKQPPEMLFILDESAIRRHVGGPRTMRRQLERLKQWSTEPHITIQVLPFTAGAHPGMTGPFTLLDFPDANDDDLVYLEHVSGSTTHDDPELTSPYVERFFALEEMSLSPEDTKALLDDAIQDLKKTDSNPVAAETGG